MSFNLFAKFSRRFSAIPTPPPIVAYCTDVEGDMEFWNRYIRNSQVLKRDPTSGNLILQDGVHFVFGGDAVDQGPGDLAFLRDLITLHHNHPGRVHVIMGNRDINKMRLAQELSAEHVRTHPWKTYPGVYWRGDAGIDHSEPDTLTNRLKWILQCTMGSDRTFELRRTELGGAVINDEQVVSSFVDSLKPQGLLREYLKIGQIGVVLGDTLFVHGGLSSEVVGWVPNIDGKESNARTWIQKLNIFCQHNVRMFCDEIDHPTSYSNTTGKCWSMEGGYGTAFGGGDLMQYGMGWLPDESRNKTVIYRDWFQPPSSHYQPPLNGKHQKPTTPRSLDPNLVDYLRRAQISRVVTGHKPHGDASLVIRSNDNDLTVLTLDTSYSGRIRVVEEDEIVVGVGGDGGDGVSISVSEDTTERRGCAVSELLVYFEDEKQEGDSNNMMSSRAVVYGIDAAGNDYICEPDSHDSLVGYIDEKGGGWTVKGKRLKDDKLILGRLVGWDFENMYIDRDEFLQKIAEHSTDGSSSRVSKL
jgi:hypothetical protein